MRLARSGRCEGGGHCGTLQVEVALVLDLHLATAATMGKHMTTAQRKNTYPKPSNVVGQYYWRWEMWVHSTFALGMLEPWENFLVGTYLQRTVFCGDDSLDLVTPSRALPPGHRLAGRGCYSIPSSPPGVPV